MFINRYTLTEGSDKVGLGLPTPKDTTISASIHPTMGSKASFTNTKNHDANQVKTANKSAETGEKKYDSKSHVIQSNKDSKESKGNSMLDNIVVPLRESTWSDGVLFARVEQLLQESKVRMIEEFHNTRNENFPTSGAGGQTGNKGTETYMKTGEKPTVDGYKRDVSRKMEDERARKSSNQHAAAKVEPQIGARGKTLGITQQATNQNAQTKAQSVENTSQKIELQNQAAQAAQNG